MCVSVKILLPFSTLFACRSYAYEHLTLMIPCFSFSCLLCVVCITDFSGANFGERPPDFGHSNMEGATFKGYNGKAISASALRGVITKNVKGLGLPIPATLAYVRRCAQS
jgi:hypothetical protein